MRPGHHLTHGVRHRAGGPRGDLRRLGRANRVLFDPASARRREVGQPAQIALTMHTLQPGGSRRLPCRLLALLGQSAALQLAHKSVAIGPGFPDDCR